MIGIEQGLTLSHSASKVLRYLDKTYPDALIRVSRRREKPSNSSCVETTVQSQTVGRESLTQSSRESHLRFYETDPSQLVTSWDKELTLLFKKWASWKGIRPSHVVRTSDLGIRSPKGAVALGVILEATYSLAANNKTSQMSQSMKFLVIPQGISAGGYNACTAYATQERVVLVSYDPDTRQFTTMQVCT